MTTTTIEAVTLTDTDRKFIAALYAAVKERGADYTYPKPQESGDDKYYQQNLCVYKTPDGTPACLIGVAGVNAGLYMPDYDAEPVGAVDALQPFDVSYPVSAAAEVAQSFQDRGRPWGEALLAFEDELKERLALTDEQYQSEVAP